MGICAFLALSRIKYFPRNFAQNTIVIIYCVEVVRNEYHSYGVLSVFGIFARKLAQTLLCTKPCTQHYLV